MSSSTSLPLPQGFDRFLDLSARIGQDILRTQGAGGNTSIKQGGTVWVKASGTWLAQALERNIMVPVLVDPLVEALVNGDPRAEKATDFVVETPDGAGLRPSIETSFHAALPQSVVAHFHCVNTIALAVLEDREATIAGRMATLPDLTYETIPYRRPGTPLAREIERVAARRPDVLVLFNHGLIVCGDSVEEVSERIERVTNALSSPTRPTPVADIAALDRLAEGSGYHAAGDPRSHQTALDPDNMKIALGGSLYPDHVIFLGTSLGVLPEGQSVRDFIAGFEARGETPPPMVLAAGKGVLLSRKLTPGGEAMARCLAEVVARIPADATVAYLSGAEEYELTHWEAEQYRQALDRKANGH